MTKLFLTRQPAFTFFPHYRGQRRPKWLWHCKGKVSQHFFLVKCERGNRADLFLSLISKVHERYLFSKQSAAKAKMERILSDSSLYQLTAMETAKSVWLRVCQKLKGHDNPWALMHVHKLILSVKKSWQREQLQHTHTRRGQHSTDWAAIQTALGNSNPRQP